jgi:DNA-binding beta-propeller fold protein YncE
MKTYVCMVFVALTLVAGVFAQSNTEPHNKYDIKPWGQPPNNEWGGTISVTTDGKGQVFVLRRLASPQVLIFNRDGKLLRSWGDALFGAAHSIDIDRFGFVWVTDNEENVVYKFTQDGKQLMTLGRKGIAGNNASTDLFDGPSDVAVADNGDFFVTDGYRNSRIVKFSKNGKFLKIIGGTKGTGPGEFDLVHGIVIDSKGRLLVIEERNQRVQVFDQDGKLLEIWKDLGIIHAAGIAITRDDTLYIGDVDGNSIPMVKNGKLVDTIRGLEGRPHNIVIDEGTGDIYMADFSGSKMIKQITPQKKN